MCRSIIQLRGPAAPEREAIAAAALQYVRKVSGYRQPSRANSEVFDRAVAEFVHLGGDLEADKPMLDALRATQASAE